MENAGGMSTDAVDASGHRGAMIEKAAIPDPWSGERPRRLTCCRLVAEEGTSVVFVSAAGNAGAVRVEKVAR
jgi:hypothetical protein